MKSLSETATSLGGGMITRGGTSVVTFGGSCRRLSRLYSGASAFGRLAGILSSFCSVMRVTKCTDRFRGRSGFTMGSLSAFVGGSGCNDIVSATVGSNLDSCGGVLRASVIACSTCGCLVGGVKSVLGSTVSVSAMLLSARSGVCLLV